MSRELSETISDLSAAWQDGGLAAPVAASPHSTQTCYIEDCASMTFVEIKTPAGLRSLCFKHFESVREDLDGV